MQRQVKDKFDSSPVQYYVDTVKNVGDIYEFGVCTGSSLEDIIKQFRACRIPFRKVFGFDSFEGLPEEAPGIDKNKGWFRGNYNVQELLKVSRSTAKELILERTDNLPHLIDGWFKNTLNSKTVKQYDMRNASYINIDVDLYRSTCEVLRFIFDNNLWQPGTIIRYDDWEDGKNYGEELAHNEMMDLYGIECIHHYHYTPNTRLVEIIGRK